MNVEPTNEKLGCCERIQRNIRSIHLGVIGINELTDIAFTVAAYRTSFWLGVGYGAYRATVDAITFYMAWRDRSLAPINKIAEKAALESAALSEGTRELARSASELNITVKDNNEKEEVAHQALANLQKQLQDRTQELTDLHGRVEKYETDNRQREIELTDMRATLQTFDSTASSTKVSLSIQLKAFAALFKKTQAENKALLETQNGLKESLKQRQIQIDELQQEITKLKSALDSNKQQPLDKAVEKMSQHLTVQAAVENKAEADIAKLEQLNRERDTQLAQLKAFLEQTGPILKLQQENAALKAELAQLKQQQPAPAGAQ